MSKQHSETLHEECKDKGYALTAQTPIILLIQYSSIPKEDNNQTPSDAVPSIIAVPT
jgi:hypothetical protein